MPEARSVRAALAGLVLLFALGAAACGSSGARTGSEEAATDLLPAWNDGPAKQAIVDFVERVTARGTDDYVPIVERIAVFDNDGTLWVEKPAYIQLFYALDRVRAMAGDHPEWTDAEPFASVLSGDPDRLHGLGEHDLLTLIGATHSGMPEQEFQASVVAWMGEARHPRFDRPYTELTYLPMVELLDYLRVNRFLVYIVTGGGVSFVRTISEELYAVPRSKVVGSRIVWEYVDGKLLRRAEIDHLNDKGGKPVGIAQVIGRRPLAAFGNSDGDLAMMEYAADGDGPRFCLYVRHDDAEREWAYDRDSSVGRLDRGLEVAAERGWTVVSMKDDWNRVFAFEEPR